VTEVEGEEDASRQIVGFFFTKPSFDAGRRGGRDGIRIDYDIPQHLSDGTVLVADVFRPARSGRYPTILIRTPYDKLATAVRVCGYGLDPLALVRAGFVVVIQDVRGTFGSDGDFRKYLHESADGAETVAWVTAQEWSNGSVGMAGASYLGHAALFAAIAGAPGLRAVAPINTPAAHYEGAEYQGGAFQLGRNLYGALGMALPALRRGEGDEAELARVSEMAADIAATYRGVPLLSVVESSTHLADYGEWLTHPAAGELGTATAIDHHLHEVAVAGLHVGGWYDVHLRGTLATYTGLRDRAETEAARASQRLIISPAGHTAPTDIVGDLWFPGAAAFDYQSAYIAFFGTHLRGDPPPGDAPVLIYVMGENRWRAEQEWPLSRAVPTAYYLRSDGRLSCDAALDEKPDVFVYDPHDPVPTIGGNTLMPGPAHLAGPRDRRAIQRRADVIVYTSEPLTEPVEVTGPLSARIFVATSAPDTDITVTLVDVHPDGRAMGIADGIQRLRYRDDPARPSLVEPGSAVEIGVDLIATSNVFLAGHRIQVEVSSSNFPRFDRNPNHGGDIARASLADYRPATQHIHHDELRPSRIMLPVIPRSRADFDTPSPHG
jgi:putative CocE/NonD family hydrolase